MIKLIVALEEASALHGLVAADDAEALEIEWEHRNIAHGSSPLLKQPPPGTKRQFKTRGVYKDYTIEIDWMGRTGVGDETAKPKGIMLMHIVGPMGAVRTLKSKYKSHGKGLIFNDFLELQIEAKRLINDVRHFATTRSGRGKVKKTTKTTPSVVAQIIRSIATDYGLPDIGHFCIPAFTHVVVDLSWKTSDHEEKYTAFLADISSRYAVSKHPGQLWVFPFPPA